MRGPVRLLALGLVLIDGIRGECDGEYELSFYNGCHRGIPSKDGLTIKFSNIQYAAPPNTSGTRFYGPEYAPYHEGVEEGLGTRICPQAFPGWGGNATTYVTEFYENTLLRMDSKWSKPITPKDYGPAPEPIGDEDCLYLDVEVPKTVWDKRKQAAIVKAPVVVWVHGGGFVLGSKYDIKGAEGLFEAANQTHEHNIIFVSINYRLGMFGWMGGTKLENDYGLANLGLLDQRQAFAWVEQYAHLFGGDVRRITAMGQSGGGASIMHHLTYGDGSERYQPVFQRAVILSPGFFPLPNDTDNNAVYTKVLEKASVKDLDALRELPSEKLIKVNQEMVWYSTYGRFTFGPSLSSWTIPSLPGQSLNEGKFHKKIRYLLGYTALDGLLFTPPWVETFDALKEFLGDIYPGTSEETIKEIKSRYPFDDKDSGESGLDQRTRAVKISNMINDLAIRCNIHYITEAAQVEENWPIYRYVFNAVPPVHGADLNYVFYPNIAFGTEKIAWPPLAKRFQRNLVDFIRYNDPNLEDKNDWEIYSKKTEK